MMGAILTRQYSAVVGQRYRETLPRQAKGVVLTNSSGHYALVRLGGSDAPPDIGSADRFIPPYTEVGFRLTSPDIAVGFTDVATALSIVGGAQGLDGVCTAVYVDSLQSDFLVGLPGATGVPGLAGASKWSIYQAERAFDTGLSPFTLMVQGPAYVRRARVTPASDASGAGVIRLFVATLPGSPQVLLGIGPVNKWGTVSAYVPPVEWGPPADGSEVFVSVLQALYASCDVNIATVHFYAEYHQ